MFDSTAELMEKIRLGEDSFLELKEVRFSGGKVVAFAREGLEKELVILANTSANDLWHHIN